ncbi:MAG: hypothetical protein ACD_66C00006G0001, partial [uncultured bacterium]
MDDTITDYRCNFTLGGSCDDGLR